MSERDPQDAKPDELIAVLIRTAARRIKPLDRSAMHPALLQAELALHEYIAELRRAPSAPVQTAEWMEYVSALREYHEIVGLEHAQYARVEAARDRLHRARFDLDAHVLGTPVAAQSNGKEGET